MAGSHGSRGNAKLRLRKMCVALLLSGLIRLIASVLSSDISIDAAEPTPSKLKLQFVAEEGQNDAANAPLLNPAAAKTITGLRLSEIAKGLALKHHRTISCDPGYTFWFERFSNIKAADIESNTDLNDALNKLVTRMNEQLAVQRSKIHMTETNGVIDLKIVGDLQHRIPPAVSKQIKGMVHTPAGQPASGQLIEVANGAGTAFVFTDEMGSFQAQIRVHPFSDLVICAIDDRSDQGAAWHQFGDDLHATDGIPAVALVLKPFNTLSVEVVDKQHRRASHIQVGATIGFVGDWVYEGQTDQNGRVDLRIPDGMRIREVFAIAPHKGVAVTKDETLIHMIDNSNPLESGQKPQPTRLTLSGAQTMKLKVVDEEGSPLSGVAVHPWYVSPEGDNRLHLNFSVNPRFGREVTNENGDVEFNWIPVSETQLTFFHDSKVHVHRYLLCRVEDAVDGSFKVVLEKPVSVIGQVLDPNQQPVAGVTVIAAGADFSGHDHFSSTTTTADGSYQLNLFPRALYTLLVRSKDQKQVGLLDGVHVLGGQPMTKQDIHLRPGTRVFGRLLKEDQSGPVANMILKLERNGPDLRKFKEIAFHEAMSRQQMDAWVWVGLKHPVQTTTANDGKFEIWLPPGEYMFPAPDTDDEHHSITSFDITDSDDLEFEYQYDDDYWRLKTKGGKVPQPNEKTD